QQQQQPPPLPQQQIAAWQAVPQMPIIPMGIYNRYVPKAIQLPTGETLKTTVPSLNANGLIVTQIEPQQTGNSKDSLRSSSRSRSISPRRNDSQQHSRALSANNAGASALPFESSHHHHHHHHHHRRQQMHGVPYSSSKPDSNTYNTISHSFRARSNGIPRVDHNINNNNNTIEDDNITKQFLKQLVDDMQAMKLEMNKIRLASSPMGTTKGRSDSARVNIKELRNDIDAIRARMTIPTKFSKQ
ncbi:unnamed protein product, partial [Rotaria magnacalcarata]